MRYLVAIGILLEATCAAAAPQSDRQAPERFASFEMRWAAQRTEAVVARVRGAAEAMTGQQLTSSPRVLPARASDSRRRLQVTVPDAPALQVAYVPEVDELHIVDTELATSTAPAADMPQERALEVARRTFDELAQRRLIEPRQYDWNRPDIGSTWVGGGSRDGQVTDKKRIEYRITLRRVINGIELANAGIRIAVHVSGRISGLRLGGVSVASRIADGVEEPTGGGRWLGRRVAPDESHARFERELVPEKAKANVVWSRVMYVMPENQRAAVVAPLYVVSYSLQFPSDAGQTMVSRRKTVGFSLVDPNARPIDLTPPQRPAKTERAVKTVTGKR